MSDKTPLKRRESEPSLRTSLQNNMTTYLQTHTFKYMHAYCCFFPSDFGYTPLFPSPSCRRKNNAIVFKDTQKKAGYYFHNAIKQQSNAI